MTRRARSDEAILDAAIARRDSGKPWRFRDAERLAKQATARAARAASIRASRDLWGIAEGDRDFHSVYTPLERWPSAVEHEFWRHECVEHFWPFFLHAWGTLHGPHARDWWIDRQEVAEPLAWWLEQQARTWLASRAEHKKLIHHIAVIVTREFGKTTMLQAWFLWLHLQDPNLSTYIGGEKESLASDSLLAIRAVLGGSDRHAQFAKMYGDWLGSEGIQRRESITHNVRSTTTRRDPSFGVWGVESGLTGRHPDAAALDDPNTYERQQAQGNWFDIVTLHCASLTPVIRVDGLFALWGTPYADNDHLAKTLRRDGIASITGLPMHDFTPRANGAWHVFHFPGRTRSGRPTVPNVWSEARMNAFELENPDRYAAQVLLRPEISERNPLTLEQIQDCMVDEKDIPMNFLRYTLHFDTAFKDSFRRDGDESVFVVWGHMRDGSGEVVYIEGHGSSLWRGEEFYREVVRLLQRYRRMGRKIVAITDEVSPGKRQTGRMMLESQCNGAGISRPGEWIEIARGGKKKLEQRIIPAATMWADGYVKLVRTAPGLDKLVAQMSRIGRSDLDDWADASADVFNPSVYRRQRRADRPDESVPAWLASPQDVILKGAAHDEALRRQYDSWVRRDEMDYEPV